MGALLVLGASVSQVDAIRRARELGFRVVAIDADPGAVGFAEADEHEVVDFSEVDAVVELGRRKAVDGVLAVSTDRAVPFAAAIAERLGLPGIGHDVAHRMTNKAAMRRRLSEAGVGQPPYAMVSADDDAEQAFARLGGPSVLKPVDSGGQRGIFLVEGVADLRRRLPEALEYSRAGGAILERFTPGSELNGIVVAVDGEAHVLTLSDRLRPPGPGFGVGWIHRFPSTLDESQLALARDAAMDAVDALGLRDGIAFPQLIATDESVEVVEVAARIPAGQMADLVRLGVGVDLYDLAIRFALGETIRPEHWLPRFRQPLAIRFFTASPGTLPTGRVTRISGLDEVRAAPGVVKADLYMQIGETIKPVQVDADRRGYVIAVADDAEKALELANNASLRLKVEADSPAGNLSTA